MKVLLVAPRTDLVMVDEEVQDILTSGLEVEPMLGKVSRAELTRKLRKPAFDVLWLATHGDETGVMLSDGILSASTITQMVRDKVSLVFLNTCKSFGVAQMLQNETGATIVCTVQDAPDQEAYHTACLFACALADTGDARAAYEQSKPGANRTYVFLSGKDKSSPSKLKAPQPEQSQGEIKELFDALLGNRLSGRVGLIDDVANIKRDVSDLRNKDVAGLKSDVAGLTGRMGSVESGIKQIQISVNERNAARDGRDELVILPQRRMLVYLVLAVMVGGIFAALVLKFFGGGGDIDSSIGAAIFQLLGYLPRYGAYHLWHVASSA